MGGEIISNLLPQLDGAGLAAVALVICYFMGLRMTEKFNNQSKILSTQNDETEARVAELSQAIELCRTESRTAISTLVQQTTAFQLEVASTRPTRAEVNESIERIAASFREVVQPMRDDLHLIKEKLLKETK